MIRRIAGGNWLLLEMCLRRRFADAMPVVFAAVLGHLAMYLVPDSMRTLQYYSSTTALLSFLGQMP